MDFNKVLELYKTAEEFADNHPTAPYESRIYAQVRMMKFAELIVLECVNVCEDVDGEDNFDAKCGRQDCVVEIKEHFGIE